MSSAIDKNTAEFCGMDKSKYSRVCVHKRSVPYSFCGEDWGWVRCRRCYSSIEMTVISRKKSVAPEFKANYSFLVFIRDTLNDVILFSGRFYKPVEASGKDKLGIRRLDIFAVVWRRYRITKIATIDLYNWIKYLLLTNWRKCSTDSRGICSKISFFLKKFFFKATLWNHVLFGVISCQLNPILKLYTVFCSWTPPQAFSQASSPTCKISLIFGRRSVQCMYYSSIIFIKRAFYVFLLSL